MTTDFVKTDFVKSFYKIDNCEKINFEDCKTVECHLFISVSTCSMNPP